ncbi:MAG: hypothetical protein ACOYJ1_15765 [Peptococcales bacterium]
MDRKGDTPPSRDVFWAEECPQLMGDNGCYVPGQGELPFSAREGALEGPVVKKLGV